MIYIIHRTPCNSTINNNYRERHTKTTDVHKCKNYVKWRRKWQVIILHCEYFYTMKYCTLKNCTRDNMRGEVEVSRFFWISVFWTPGSSPLSLLCWGSGCFFGSRYLTSWPLLCRLICWCWLFCLQQWCHLQTYWCYLSHKRVCSCMCRVKREGGSAQSPAVLLCSPWWMGRYEHSLRSTSEAVVHQLYRCKLRPMWCWGGGGVLKAEL